jgi:ABC-type proline/glycine betaine transport system ATPase subunit
MEIQDNLNTMIEEYNATYEDTDPEPITLTNRVVQNLLIESGVPEEITAKIEEAYVESFGDDIPLAENLIDSKALKANEQRKKEVRLQRQVEMLETRLEEVKQAAAADNETQLSNDDNEVREDDKVTPDYDVILQVKPEKIPQIKSQIIDGKKCIVIPINENEQATVNGLDDVI